MTIERFFDISFIASLALREKQLQQHYRPIIAVHKWFARRPGTLFRGLLLAEFGNRPVKDSFFDSHSFPDKTVADPFLGGGTPAIEANRLGCRLLGTDINPMSVWIVREELEPIDLDDYAVRAGQLLDRLDRELSFFYTTDCPLYGDRDVPVKYFLWVKTIPCRFCEHRIDLFPGYLVAENVRHTHFVFVCACCGELNHVANRDRPGKCSHCREPLRLAGPARRGKCRCDRCGRENDYPRPEQGPPSHRLFAIEYWNPFRQRQHAGRFFKKPDDQDLSKYLAAAERWKRMRSGFVPPEAIQAGDESTRLHRWGYRFFRELFNPRQLLALELTARFIRRVDSARIRAALATNLSDLLRYQNMLCRYDTRSLKSLDIFSVHGFPVGLIQCESNYLGILNKRGQLVGSGGIRNVIEKYRKAKQYCTRPFEVLPGAKTRIHISGEKIAAEHGDGPRSVDIRCADASQWPFDGKRVDAVFTDPPYFGNVQYAELMDFCYVWLRKLLGEDVSWFSRDSTRSSGELTGNQSQGKDLESFARGLAAVFRKMARSLKPGAPLVFTFHHNQAQPYFAVGTALLDARLACTATIPCPAEMGGSIHIHGTESSVVDSIFVCRKLETHGCKADFPEKSRLFEQIRQELEQLRRAGLRIRRGDIRCILYGHVTRITMSLLAPGWNRSAPMEEKLDCFERIAETVGDYKDAWVEELWTQAKRSSKDKKQLRLFSLDAKE